MKVVSFNIIIGKFIIASIISLINNNGSLFISIIWNCFEEFFFNISIIDTNIISKI